MERASGIQVGSTASGGSKLVTGGGRDQRSSTPEIGKDVSEVGMPGNAVETRNIQRELVISSPWTLSARDARLKILFKQGMQVEKREEAARSQWHAESVAANGAPAKGAAAKRAAAKVVAAKDGKSAEVVQNPRALQPRAQQQRAQQPNQAALGSPSDDRVPLPWTEPPSA